MKTALILACAGSGKRAGFEQNKLLINFNGKTCLERSLSVFIKSGLIDEYILTVSKTDYEKVKALVPEFVKLVIGGKTRTESVTNALKEVKSDIVLVHDGARPFVTEKIIFDVIASVKKFGSGITAIPSRNTVLLAENNVIKNYVGKDQLYSVQTPQGFFTKDLVKAYSLIGDKTFNDDGEVYMNAFGNTYIVQGSGKNVKLTYPEDFEILNEEKADRIGNGFDCHKLVENRKLILGGIEIPHNKGLLGHSDADVLTHAIMDAILSALSMRDIGYHFPDKDPKYHNACSMNLLSEVLKMMKDKGYKIKNLSATVMAEKPKLLNYIPKITENLAQALGVNTLDVGITATTLEGLGFVGREEGICVNATVLLTTI